MKRLLALFLALTLFLPVFAFAADLDEDELDLEEEDIDLDANEEEADEDAGFNVSEDQAGELENLTAEVELDSSIDPSNLYLNENLPDNIVNILLVGVDARGTKEVQKLPDQMRFSDDESRDKSIAKRADVQMVLSINLDDGSIKLTSIARNTYVEIPGRAKKSIIANSFGHAIYENGKYNRWIDTPETCIATVNKNFELNIRYYVAINFFGVEEIIESLGGADIELTKQEVAAINQYLSMANIFEKKNGQYVLNADGTRKRLSHGKAIANSYDNHSENRKKLEKKNGVQHLDGLQALMYARLRHTDNDFVRTSTTRHLLDTLLKSTMTRIKAGQLDAVNLIEEWIDYFSTNINPLEMLPIAGAVIGSVTLSEVESASTMISEYRIPEDGAYGYSTVDGSSVTVFKDKQQAVENLHSFIYGRYIPAGSAE